MSSHAALATIAALLLIVIFLFDLRTPLGVAGGVPYIAPVLLGAWLPWRRSPIILAVIATVLTILGYALSPAMIENTSNSITIAAANRSLGIAAIWMMAVLGTLYRHSSSRIKQEEAHLRSIIDASADAIVIIDEDGLIRSFSRNGETLLGFKEMELLGRNVSMLMPSPHRENHDGYIRRYLNTGERRIIGIGRTVEARHKDGRVIPVHLAIGEIGTPEERLFVGYIHDIRHRIRAEREARSGRNFAATILDNTDAIILVLDEAGRIVRFNTALQRTLNMPDERITGSIIWELLPDERRDEVRRRFELAWKSDESTRAEVDWNPDTGRRLRISWVISSFIDIDERRYMLATGINVSEERASQKEAVKLQHQLYRVGRINDLGEMATAIAHELNQPLTAANNYARIGQRLVSTIDDETAGKLHDVIGYLIEQTDRAGQIVRRLRLLIGKGGSERMICDINKVVADAMGLARIGFELQGVQVSSYYTDNLPCVFVDVVQIQQVVINLVRNATDALKQTEGGTLSVETRLIDNSKQVEVAVRDNGPGFPREIEESPFSPFMSTKPDGMGIGLSICLSIIEAHGGTIRAERNPEGGMVLRFTLPAQEVAESGDA